MSAPALAAHDLYKFYRAADEETRALRGVSLTVDGGELVAVTGPSGSGKSTLLACLAGLEEPTGGDVLLHGRRISHRAETDRARLRARHVGMLWQSSNLVAHLSVRDNVRLVQTLGPGEPRPVEALLESLGIDHRATALPHELSGGEAARAGLAVALASSPSILLADEPTGELDSDSEALVLHLLRELARSGSAVVVVSHSPSVAAIADRVVPLADGRVAA
ncbi:ABC transporter ATP-binding protein [Cellulomonas sp. ICMP 17802]|uniref:ABC transporter ATP-binding protein n=1 Tax=Cellulomonas sp. ICMP 17802 TaxID=3239199 RepID=UPI00351B98C8